MNLGRELQKEGAVIMAGDWNVSRTAQDTEPRLRTEEPHARARAELNARMLDEGFAKAQLPMPPTTRGAEVRSCRTEGCD